MPLFPLPGCVLLPHVTLPLHIFEQRYCSMVQDALESDRRLIAMALFEGDDWRQQYEASHAIRNVVGLGYITGEEALADGRFNLTLRGLCRASITREIEHDPYRLAYLDPLEQADVMEIDMLEHRTHLDALLHDPHLKQWAPVSAVSQWLTPETSTDALIDQTAMQVCDVDECYNLLAQPDVFKRIDWLLEFLEEAKQALKKAERLEPPELFDHMHLN